MVAVAALVAFRALAAAGAKVVLAARRADKLAEQVAQIRAAGGEAVAVSMDVTDEASTKAAYDAAEAAFGTVDTIVAADSRGGVAALAYAHQARSIELAAVELSAPRIAVPVRRGVTRVTPGAVLRSPAPIAVARFGRDLALARRRMPEMAADDPDLGRFAARDLGFFNP